MATTYTENGGNTPNGSHLNFTYSFPSIKNEDVKVALNGTTQASTKYTVNTGVNPTRIEFNNTSIDTDLQESTGAPKEGVLVRVYRDTGIEDPADKRVTFQAGSAIRALDLNNVYEHFIYVAQEEQNQKGIFESISLDDSRSIKFGNSDDASIYWDGTGNEMGHQMMITSAGPMKLSTGNNKNVQFTEGGDTVFTVGGDITAYVNVIPNADGTIGVTVKPDSNDVIPVRQQVIEIDTVATTVTAEVDDFATGSATAGVGYSTSSSTAPVGSTYTTS